MPDCAPAGISASAVTTSRPCAESSPRCSSVRLNAGACAALMATIASSAAAETLTRTFNIFMTLLHETAARTTAVADTTSNPQPETLLAPSEVEGLLDAKRLHDIDARGSHRGERGSDDGRYEQYDGCSQYRQESGDLQVLDVARREPSERESTGGADQ